MNSEARDGLLTKIRELLGEHAQGFIIMVQVEGDEDDSEITLCDWAGGFNLALGLTARMRMELDRVGADGDPPSDSGWREEEE